MHYRPWLGLALFAALPVACSLVNAPEDVRGGGGASSSGSGGATSSSSGSGGATSSSSGSGGATSSSSGSGGASAICGNGKVEAPESCDDDNTAAGDGCSAKCEVEPGYACAGAPSACAPLCGDGVVIAPEACDDGDTKADDGCSAKCAIEMGWTCTGKPSACEPICGDGMIVGDEVCDPGSDAGAPDGGGGDAGGLDGGGDGGGLDGGACGAADSGSDAGAGQVVVDSCEPDQVVAGEICDPGCKSGRKVLFADDMEKGPNGWTHQTVSTGVDNWTQSSARASCGKTAWSSGYEGGGADTRLTSPSIDLTQVPPGKTVTLSYFMYWAFDNCNNNPGFDPDGATVEVSVGGAPFAQIAPLPCGYRDAIDVGACSNPVQGQPAFTQTSGGVFAKETFDLSPFVGKSINVGFHLGWDCGNCPPTPTDPEDGVFIDDVVVDYPL